MRETESEERDTEKEMERREREPTLQVLQSSCCSCEGPLCCMLGLRRSLFTVSIRCPDEARTPTVL